MGRYSRDPGNKKTSQNKILVVKRIQKRVMAIVGRINKLEYQTSKLQNTNSFGDKIFKNVIQLK